MQFRENTFQQLAERKKRSSFVKNLLKLRITNYELRNGIWDLGSTKFGKVREPGTWNLELETWNNLFYAETKSIYFKIIRLEVRHNRTGTRKKRYLRSAAHQQLGFYYREAFLLVGKEKSGISDKKIVVFFPDELCNGRDGRRARG